MENWSVKLLKSMSNGNPIFPLDRFKCLFLMFMRSDDLLFIKLYADLGNGTKLAFPASYCCPNVRDGWTGIAPVWLLTHMPLLQKHAIGRVTCPFFCLFSLDMPAIACTFPSFARYSNREISQNYKPFSFKPLLQWASALKVLFTQMVWRIRLCK